MGIPRVGSSFPPGKSAYEEGKQNKIPSTKPKKLHDSFLMQNSSRSVNRTGGQKIVGNVVSKSIEFKRNQFKLEAVFQIGHGKEHRGTFHAKLSDNKYSGSISFQSKEHGADNSATIQVLKITTVELKECTDYMVMSLDYDPGRQGDEAASETIRAKIPMVKWKYEYYKELTSRLPVKEMKLIEAKEHLKALTPISSRPPHRSMAMSYLQSAPDRAPRGRPTVKWEGKNSPKTIDEGPPDNSVSLDDPNGARRRSGTKLNADKPSAGKSRESRTREKFTAGYAECENYIAKNAEKLKEEDNLIPSEPIPKQPSWEPRHVLERKAKKRSYAESDSVDLERALSVSPQKPKSVHFSLGDPQKLVCLYNTSDAQSKDSIEIRQGDINRLEENEFLNDTLIKFWTMVILVEKCSPKRRAEVHVYNSYFYSKLTSAPPMESFYNLDTEGKYDAMYNRVERWTRKVDIFSKKLLFIPINQHAHWYLIIVFMPRQYHAKPLSKDEVKENSKDKDQQDGTEDSAKSDVQNSKQSKGKVKLEGPDSDDSEAEQEEFEPGERGLIVIMDSLIPDRRPKVAAHIREYLTREWNRKRLPKGEPPINFTNRDFKATYAHVPQQANSVDCGLFLLQFVESQIVNPLKCTKIPMDASDWFKPSIIKNKRKEIRDKCLALNLQQNRDGKPVKSPVQEAAPELPAPGDVNADTSPPQPVKRIIGPTPDIPTVGSSELPVGTANQVDTTSTVLATIGNYESDGNDTGSNSAHNSATGSVDGDGDEDTGKEKIGSQGSEDDVDMPMGKPLPALRANAEVSPRVLTRPLAQSGQRTIQDNDGEDVVGTTAEAGDKQPVQASVHSLEYTHTQSHKITGMGKGSITKPVGMGRKRNQSPLPGPLLPPEATALSEPVGYNSSLANTAQHRQNDAFDSARDQGIAKPVEKLKGEAMDAQDSDPERYSTSPPPMKKPKTRQDPARSRSGSASSMPSPLKKPLSPEADENLLKTYLKNKDENAGVMEASVPESNQVIDLASSDDEAAAAPDTAALPTSVKSGPVAIRSNGTELSVLNSDGKSLTKSGDAGTNMAISDESQPLTSISNDSGTNSGTKSGTSSGPKIIGTGIAARARRNHENQIGADKSTVDMSQSVKAMPTVLIGSLENYQRISAEAIKPSSTSTVLTEYAYKKQNNTSDTAASPTDLAPESDPKPPTPLKIDTLKEAKIMTPSSSQANVYIAGDSLLRTDDMSPPPPVLLGTRAQSSDVVDVPDESPYSDSNIPPEGSVVEHARMPTNEHVDVESDTTELTHTDTAGYKPDEEPSRLSDGVGEHINVDTSESAEDEDSGEGNGGDHSNPEIMDRALPRALPDHMREDKDSFVTNVSTHDLTDAVSKDVDPASVNHVDVVSSTSMLGRGASGKNRNEAISSDNTKDRGWYETQQQALHTTANAIHTAEKSFSEMDIVSQTTDGKKKVVIGVGSAPPKKSTNTAEVPARSRVLGNMINTETGKESAESMTGRDPMPGKDDNTLGESRPGVEKQSVDVGVSRKVYELDDTGVAHKGVVTGTHGPMEGKGSVPEDEDMRMSGSAMEEKMKDIYSGVSGTKDLDGTGLTGVLTNSTSVQYKHSLQPDTKYDTSHTQRKGKLEQPITSSMVVGSTDRPDVVVKTTTTPKLEKQSMSGATAPGLTNQAAPEKKKKVVIGQGESRYATQGPYRPTESSKARPYTQTHIQTPNKPRLLHPVAHASAPTTTPASTTSTKGGVTAKLNNLSLDRAPKSSPYATLGRANLEPGTIRKLQELSCKGGRKAKFFIPTVKGSVPTSVIKITPQSTATSQPVPSAQPDRKLHEQHSEKAKPAQLKRPSLDRTQSNISTNAKPIKRKHSSSDYMQSSLSTLTTDSNPFRSEKVLNAPRLISDIHASKPKAQGAGINSTQIASPRAHSRKDGRFSRSLSPIAATKSGSGEVPYEQSITISDDEPRGGVSRAKIKTRVVTIDSDNEVAEDSGSRAQSKSPVNSRSKAVSHGPIAGRLGELEWESESNDEDKPKKDRGRGKKQIMLGLERTNILAESMKRHGLNKSAANTPRPGSRQTDRSDREKGGKSRHKKEKCKGQRNTMDNYGVSGNSVKKSQRRHQDIVELDDKDDLTEFMVNRPDLAFLADHKSDEHTDMKPDTHPTLGDKKHIQTHTDKHKTSSKSARAQYTIEDMRAPRSGPISNVPGHSNRQSISPARRSRRRSTTSSSVEHESPGLHKHTDARTQKSRRASRTYTTSDFDGNTHAYRSAANASKGKGKKRGRTGREGPFKAQSYSETIDVDGDDSADDPNESMMSGPGGLTPATAKSYKRNKTRYSSLVN